MLALAVCQREREEIESAILDELLTGEIMRHQLNAAKRVQPHLVSTSLTCHRRQTGFAAA
jgi:hypothetical protein